MHVRPVGPARRSWLSLLLIISILAGTLPTASVSDTASAATRAAPPSLPVLSAPAPLGAAALSRAPRGLSDIRTSVERDTTVEVSWMSDQAYNIEVEYGATERLGQRTRPATIRRQQLTSGGYVNTLTLPAHADLRFYRLRAVRGWFNLTAARSPIQQIGQANAPTAQLDHSAHHHDAMQRQPAPEVAAAPERTASFQTTTPAQPVVNSNQVFCEYGGFGNTLSFHRPQCSQTPSGLDPITIGDGAWYMSIPCLTVDGAGLPMAVGLRYSTHMWFDSIGMSSIGRGWTVGYGRRLTFTNLTADYYTPTPSLMLTLETGERWPFYAAGNGTYTNGPGNYTRLAYNATTTQYTLTYRDGSRDIFDSTGLLTRVEDRFGNQTLISPISATGVITITNNRTSQAILLEHEQRVESGQTIWKLVRIKDGPSNGGAARQISLSYNASGQLTRVTDAANRVYTFAYDASGRIDTYYDPNNDPAVVASPRFMRNVYETNGFNHRVRTQTLPSGATAQISFAYGAPIGRMTITYNPGLADQRVVSYDMYTRANGGLAGRITRATLPNSSNAATMSYDNNGNLTTVTDPMGRRTQYIYDASGDLREVRVYKDGSTYDTTLMEYNSFGQMTRLIEPAGAVTEWTYDATTGAPQTVVRRATLGGTPVVQTTTIETNPVLINGVAVQTGLVTGVRLPDGTWNTQAYDGRGYPTLTTYDANYGGNTGRLALTKSTVFDWRGYLTSATDVQGITSSYEYGSGAGQFGAVGWPSATVWDGGTGGRAIRTEYTYDAAGNVLREVQDAGTGRRNATWQYAYAPVGFEGGYDVSQLTDPLSQITRYSYTSYGELRQLTEVNPRPGQPERNTVFDYTTEGWLRQVRLHDNRAAETYAHNFLGETVAVTDAAGVATAYGYDAKGRLSFTTDQFIQDTNVARGKTPTQSSTYSTAVANLAVDGNRSTSAFTNTQAQPYWDLDLGAAHELSTIHVYGDPNHTLNIYVFVSDTPFTSADPNVTRTQPGVSATYIEGPISAQTPVAVGRSGRYVRVQMTGSGYLGLYEVEVYGRTAVPATAQLTRYVYDANDRATVAASRVTSATARVLFERSYDGFNRLAWERDGVANQTTYSYDNSRDWPTLVTVGSNNAAEQVQTQYSYDRVGRMTQQIVDPGVGRKNLTTNHFYSVAGSNDRWHLQATQDPRGFVTNYRYNSLGLLAQTIDAQLPPAVWTYEYDNLGAPTRITPPAGAVTTFSPDLLGRTGSLSRNGQTESWAYNADGTLASHTNFASQITSYGYDTTGRLTTVDRPGANADATFAYTANDLLQSATSKPDGVTDETTAYSYDPRNRLQTRTRDSRTLSYGYNLDNTLQRLTYWTRGDVTYGYDNAAQPTAINPWAAGATSYAYRSTGQLRNVTRPAANGITTTYGYDTAGRLTGMEHAKGATTIESIQYALDANGNPIQQTDSNGTTTYDYDVLNRLTQAQHPPVSGGPPAAVEHLRYDAVGNRTARSGALAARWQMEGNAADTSGNGQVSGVLGAVTVPGKVGDALSFDGVDDYMQVAHSSSLALGEGGADFSVAFWFNLQENANGGWREVIHKGNTTYERTLGIWLAPGENRLYAMASTTANWNEAMASSVTIPLNTWTHIAYVKSGNQVKLYINGVLDGTMYLTGAIVSNTGPIFIGKDPWHYGTKSFFDEIEIYQKALSDAEMLALVGGATRAARWSLEGGSVADSSGNATATGVVGAVVATGKVGGALSFDGVDDYIGVAHSSSLALGQGGADFSVSFWLNPRQGPTGVFRSVMHKGNYDGERTIGLWLGPYDNKLYFAISTTANWNEYSFTSDLPLNTWTHVAYVKSGSQIKLYLNGTLNSALNLTGTVVGNNGPLYIGKDPWYSGTNGLFDEIEIFQKALSDAEVRNEVVRTDYQLGYDASDRIAASQGYTYDLNGNLTQDASGTTYTYDAANRLIRTVKAGVTTEYFYDALGNLVRQRVNGSATSYILDESGGLPRTVGELRADGSETLYAYGPEGLAARRDIIASAVSTSYPLVDRLGSARSWTSAADGSVQQRLTYDAWGVLRHVAGVNPAGGAGLRNGLGYTGEPQRDDGTVHLRARVYQPQLGRLLQRDSFAGFAARPQSLNRYAYVENNPTNSIDPGGNIAIPAGGGLIAACAANPVLCAGVVIVGGGVALCTLYCDRVFNRSPAPPVTPLPPAEPTPRPGPPRAGPHSGNRAGKNNIVNFERPGRGNREPRSDSGGRRTPPPKGPNTANDCPCRPGYEDILEQFGVDRSEFAKFLRGDPVLTRFYLPGQNLADGVSGGLQLIGKRLVAGISEIEEANDNGARLFGRFRDLARKLAKLCDAEEIQYYGSNIKNKGILEMLTRQGYQPTTIQNPASTDPTNRLEVLSKIERVRRR